MMKKNTFWIFLPFFYVIIFFAFKGCQSCVRKNHDYVTNEFKWIKNLNLDLADPILEDLGWYQIYDINENQMEQLLANDLSEYRYTGWKDFHGDWSIGASTPYTVNGERDNIKVNFVTGSDDFDRVSIFVDTSNMRLILHYGRTYGM